MTQEEAKEKAFVLDKLLFDASIEAVNGNESACERLRKHAFHIESELAKRGFIYTDLIRE